MKSYVRHLSGYTIPSWDAILSSVYLTLESYKGIFEDQISERTYNGLSFCIHITVTQSILQSGECNIRPDARVEANNIKSEQINIVT